MALTRENDRELMEVSGEYLKGFFDLLTIEEARELPVDGQEHRDRVITGRPFSGATINKTKEQFLINKDKPEEAWSPQQKLQNKFLTAFLNNPDLQIELLRLLDSLGSTNNPADAERINMKKKELFERFIAPSPQWQEVPDLIRNDPNIRDFISSTFLYEVLTKSIENTPAQLSRVKERGEEKKATVVEKKEGEKAATLLEKQKSAYANYKPQPFAHNLQKSIIWTPCINSSGISKDVSEKALRQLSTMNDLITNITMYIERNEQVKLETVLEGASKSFTKILSNTLYKGLGNVGIIEFNKKLLELINAVATLQVSDPNLKKIALSGVINAALDYLKEHNNVDDKDILKKEENFRVLITELRGVISKNENNIDKKTRERFKDYDTKLNKKLDNAAKKEAAKAPNQSPVSSGSTTPVSPASRSVSTTPAGSPSTSTPSSPVQSSRSELTSPGVVESNLVATVFRQKEKEKEKEAQSPSRRTRVNKSSNV